MIVASEIENNAGVVPDRLGLGEVGSALILDDGGDGGAGFGTFVFKYFPKYLDAVNSSSSFTVSEGKNKPSVKYSRDACLEDHYVECIPDAVAEALEAEALDLSRVKLILPAQMSAAFISKLADRLGVPRGRFVDVGQNGVDLFTSSLAYSLQHAVRQERVEAGDIGLIIGVGSGIQVGCVAYYF